jgi:hypothetical protein
MGRRLWRTVDSDRALEGWEPMRPLTLGPDDQAGILMFVHVTSCLPEAGELSWNLVPVRFSVFGVLRWDFVQTDIQIVLRGVESC